MNSRHSRSVDNRLRVTIVANYAAYTPNNNTRFNDLARRFASRGVHVELVTSRFSHTFKAMREGGAPDTTYSTSLVHEPGYSRNVSLARLRSQSVFATSVARHLDSLAEPPHLLLAAAPPPAVIRACGLYAQRVGARFAIDIQDLWPEAFSMVTKFPRVVDLGFSSMRRHSSIAYGMADRILGVSRTYIDSAVAHGARPDRTSVVYLGTDLNDFDRNATSPGPVAVDPEWIDDEGRIGPTIGYAGGLSASYDLKLVIDALELLASTPQAGPIPALVVMGDGAMRDEFEAYAQGKGLRVRFTGKLPYMDMVRTLAACRIAINPIVPGSAGSVLNKAGDYAAAGLPVINSQESPEYRELLELYGAGISCAPRDAQQMADAIQRLAGDASLRSRMGAGSRQMAEELFDRSVTYERMVDELLELASDVPAMR